uniref:GH18 domain-containing protein n=1 Tax=Mucochytrium quahogii TaxID=96639 RepID=A0A7S2WJ24_9STRA|mmetsp:Transcript_20836/g.34077  ORF Transcript_20836/g.34077 Transcript_20836/m.34077 type:complete len:314 (-) Transcript_20836:98-1039(-)
MKILFLLWLLSDAVCGFDIVGYFPEWRFRFLDEDHEHRLRDICSHLTHLLLFSVEVDVSGKISALDRWPNGDRMNRVRRVCSDTKLLVCFGGNGRSGGFSSVVRDSVKRGRLIKELGTFMEKHELDGVDWNWEYPSSREDWVGLRALIGEMRVSSPSKVQTLAYYPDTRQEAILSNLAFGDVVDRMHMMSYDQPGTRHSTFDFAKRCVDQGIQAGLDAKKLTLGLPFYARHIRTGDWKTFHDVMKTAPKEADENSDQLQGYYFNNVNTIKKKTMLARSQGLGGVMIWESGQDTVDIKLHRAISDALVEERTEL